MKCMHNRAHVQLPLVVLASGPISKHGQQKPVVIHFAQVFFFMGLSNGGGGIYDCKPIAGLYKPR